MYSVKAGRWPGSSHPLGDCMRATLTAASPEFTRPTYSSMRLGRLPAAAITVGASISFGMVERSHAAAPGVQHAAGPVPARVSGRTQIQTSATSAADPEMTRRWKTSW